MTEVEPPSQNGIDLSAEDENKIRPADIEQDMREMERRKRVEAIMGSKLFREELERIVDAAREGGASGILQQLSDMVGLPPTRVGNVLRPSNCMLPINDIRGIDSMGYAKGEKILRCKLAATFRLLDLYGWVQGLDAQITARLKVDQEAFLVNPYGLLYKEITASSLNKVDMQGNLVEQGTTNFGVNKNRFALHSVVHSARPDLRCIIFIDCNSVIAVSSSKYGILPLSKGACVLGEISVHPYTGPLTEVEERDKLVRNLGPISKVLLLSNQGALCCGESIEEAFFAACHIVQACETQLKLLPVGIDNIILIPEEMRKTIYEDARRPPEDLEKKFSEALANNENNQTAAGNAGEDTKDVESVAKTVAPQPKTIPKWRVGGAEFEALMRWLDNAGFRTGYMYRHPLVKMDLPKPKNDVELPPAVSSLGYLLEEEELYRQGIWKKTDFRKGGDRSKWLNSPNVYQKVEVLETGTPDPKKITKWVAEGSPTHGTPVRIEDPLQFVPTGTNPREFKRIQQQIKDNRRADKISAGPQSHILEGVTWEEANRVKDATVSSTGDHVVFSMGAASKGIIQRGFQHNATMYKAPYAKNPFDNVTDDELNEYKRTVEGKKKSIHGEYTDTDFSESEALSSLHLSAGATLMKAPVSAVSQSEPEDNSEHQILRIETQQAPVPSQPEVVLSDVTKYANASQECLPLRAFNTSIQNSAKSYKNHLNSLNEQKFKRNNLLYSTKNHALLQKYAFLFEKLSEDVTQDSLLVHLFVIHKIEVFPNFTYPLAVSHSMADEKDDERQRNTLSQMLTLVHTSSPYRTFSHYGFNYPLNYLPSIPLYPSTFFATVEMQRQNVIKLISSSITIFDAVQAKKKAQIEEDCTSQVATQTFLDKHDSSYISMKEIQLRYKGNGNGAFSRRPLTNCKFCSTPQTQKVSGVGDGEHEIHDTNSEQLSSIISINDSYPFINNSSHIIYGHDPCDVESSSSSGGGVGAGDSAKVWHRSYILKNSISPIDLKKKKKCSSLKGVRLKEDFERNFYLPSKTNEDHTSKESHADEKLNLILDQSETSEKDSCGWNQDGNLHPMQINNLPFIEVVDAPTFDTVTSLKSIEIHISVEIENTDGMKNLQIKAQELKMKLAKIIDDEIALITTQLANKNNKLLLTQKSYAEITNSRMPADSSTVEIERTATFEEQPSQSQQSPQKFVSEYTDTLWLLEHELGNLLNNIIRANELHNRALISDCKTKISQLSQDIRASLVHSTKS